MPAHTVKVDRSTPWGNPFKLGARGIATAADSIRAYRSWLRGHPEVRRAAREQLAGLNLACWCPLDGPCHADVLLAAANSAPNAVSS
jgi:hypothetical protein